MMLSFLSLSWKNAYRRRGQYAILVAMIAFGVMMVTLVRGLTVGMRDNVIEGATRFQGGRYLVFVDKPNVSRSVDSYREIESELLAEGIRPALIVPRVNYADEPSVYFNGQAQRLRRVTGVDWKKETSRFAALDFVEGGASGMAGSDGILISARVARKFGLRAGDDLTLRVTARSGYVNTGDFVVRGVYNDASIFGYYNCYLDIDKLRALLGYGSDECNQIGLSFGRDGPAQARRAYDRLSKKHWMYPPGTNRKQLDTLMHEIPEGQVRVGLLPLERYMDGSVMNLVAAVELVSYVVLAFILLIILIGIRNTVRIMVHKRIKGFGCLRAIGLSRGGTVALILSETLIVASAAFVISLVAAVAGLSILSCVKFPWVPGFDIFLRAGYFSWRIPLPFVAEELAVVLAVSLAGAWGPARYAATVDPVLAMTKI
jgi:putative ABC transport system permease protein